jgi:hypothetical protein
VETIVEVAIGVVLAIAFVIYYLEKPAFNADGSSRWL